MSEATRSTTRRPRPCANCQRRKRRCVTEPGQEMCILCKLYGLDDCKVSEQPRQRPRKQTRQDKSGQRTSPPTIPLKSSGIFCSERDPAQEPCRNKRPDAPAAEFAYPSRSAGVVEDYDTWKSPSLLKNNLGLQQHRFSRCNGPSGPSNSLLLNYFQFNERDEFVLPNQESIRRVSSMTSFVLHKYSGTSTRAKELDQLDQIESLVAPHGPSLVSLYFRIVHSYFPILHKTVFVEKYARTHREFSPPCLGGVYLLALEWWDYDPVLSPQQKPDTKALQALVRNTLNEVIRRPKLSALQGALLLLQYQPFDDDAWALTAQTVAIMQELGVHLDCETWRIPQWEKGLRRRLAWNIYILDKWMALIHGRPSHIQDELDWTVEPLTEQDFDEDDDGDEELDGSGDNAKGRLTFERHIALSQIVNESLRTVYSARAQKSNHDIETLLKVVKPIQIKLREWRQALPDELNTEHTVLRRTSATVSLHLEYYASEITLHKAIILALSGGPHEESLINVCRNAARERAIVATNFVKSLNTSQWRSFWYFASGMNLVYVGMFTALLFLTSRTIEEAKFYQDLLRDYRWTLRVISPVARCIDFAVQQLDTSLQHLDELSPDDVVFTKFDVSQYWNEQNEHIEISNSGRSSSSTSVFQPAPSSAIQVPTLISDMENSYSTLDIVQLEASLNHMDSRQMMDRNATSERCRSPFAESLEFPGFN